MCFCVEVPKQLCCRLCDEMASINAQFEEEREVVASEHLQHAMMEVLDAEEETLVRARCEGGT